MRWLLLVETPGSEVAPLVETPGSEGAPLVETPGSEVAPPGGDTRQ